MRAGGKDASPLTFPCYFSLLKLWHWTIYHFHFNSGSNLQKMTDTTWTWARLKQPNGNWKNKIKDPFLSACSEKNEKYVCVFLIFLKECWGVVGVLLYGLKFASHSFPVTPLNMRYSCSFYFSCLLFLYYTVVIFNNLIINVTYWKPELHYPIQMTCCFTHDTTVKLF